MKEPTRDTSPQPCAQWVERLSALQLHDLTPSEQEKTEKHIATCVACSSVLEQYRQMDRLLKGIPAVLPHEPLSVHLLIQTERKHIEMHLGEQMPAHAIIEQEKETLITQGHQDQQKGSMRRLLQIMSTLAAVLVVAAIATSAFVLFSHRNQVSTFGNPATFTQAVYYNPEIPGNAGRANIYAFNPDNGFVLWRTHLQTKLNTSLMTQYQGKVFAPGYDGNMYALDAYSGQVLWKYSIKHDPVYPGASQSDNSPSSAITAGNTMFFGAPSGLYAVDTNSGKLLWHKKPLPTCQGAQATQSGNTTIVNISSSCNIVPVAATKDIVFTYIDGIYALKASTGEIVWSNKNIPFAGYNRLVVAGEKIYLVTLVARGNSCGSRLSILHVNSGHVIKTLDSPGCDGNVTASKGIVVFNSDQSLIAFNSTSDTVLWQKQTAFKMNFLLATSDGYAYYQGIANIKQNKANINVESYDESYYALNIQTGTIQWKWTRTLAMVDGIGSPGGGVVVNGKLCFFYVSDFSNTGKEGMFVIDNGKKSFYPLPSDWQS